MVKSIWLEIFRLWSGAFFFTFLEHGENMKDEKVTRHSSLFIFSA